METFDPIGPQFKNRPRGKYKINPPRTPTSVPTDSTTKVAGLPTMPPSRPGPQALIC